MHNIASFLKVRSFKEDNAPQAIVLMGLPAAGKSTFINTVLRKFYPTLPHVKGFKVLNSDSQLKKTQYVRAKSDFELLKDLDEKAFKNKISEMTYKSNDGAHVKLPMTYEKFQTLKKLNDYWNATYKTYYASYFGERAQAQHDTQELTDKKFSGGDVVIVDTTGQAVDKYLKMFERTKAQGYTNSVVFLHLPVEFAIARDNYRGETEGRSVGENVINSINGKLPSAYQKMKGSKLVDRYLKFNWDGTVIKGQFNKAEDKKKYPYKK